MRIPIALALATWLFGCGVPPTEPIDAGPGQFGRLRIELFYDGPQIEEARAFYTEVIGMELDPASEPDFVILRLGAVVLDLNLTSGLGSDHYFRPEIETSRRGLGVEIVIEVADVSGLYARVVAAGYPVESTLRRRSWGATDFRVADPGGYYVRFTSP